MKERRQPPVVILQHAIFYHVPILCLWLRNHQKLQSRCLVHEFSLTDILTILVMVTELLY